MQRWAFAWMVGLTACTEGRFPVDSAADSDPAAVVDSEADLPPPDSDAPVGEDSPVDSPPEEEEDQDVPPADPGDTDDVADDPTPYNGCMNPDGVKSGGTLDDPRPVASLPYTDADTTVGATSDIADRYDCALDKRETGPERWYRFELAEARDVRIEVLDGSSIDIDVHLMQDPEVDAGTVSGCVARADLLIERELAAGTWWVVADTWSSADGTEYPGAYTLAVEAWIDGEWVDVPLADGALWRHRQTSGSRPQRVDAVFLDPTRWSLAPVRHEGCESVRSVAASEGARFGINAAFFEMSGVCPPRTFLRVDGETLYRPDLGSRQRASLWNDGEVLTYAWIDKGADNTTRDFGVGSYPSVRADGATVVEPNGTTDFFIGRHPRTGFGTTADGRAVMVVVDGRSSTASGLSLSAFGDLMGELGVNDGVNLDGGGSSTLFIAGCSVNGVVNFPSDGGGDDHAGLRSVADGVYAWESR